MHSPNRRGVLAGLASLAAAPAAEAAIDPIAGKVRALRERWEKDQQELVLSFIPDRRFDVADPVVARLRTLGRGLTAVPVLHDLAELSVEDQAHPDVQRAIRTLAGAFGETMLRCRDLIEGFFEEAEEGDFVQLHGALRVLRLSSAEWNISPRRKRMLRDGFELAESPDDPQARRSLARMAKRITRLEALVERAEAESSADDLLDRASRRQEEQVARGIARHGPASIPQDRDTLVYIGLILLGVIGVLAGGTLILAGICSIGCGSPAGILLILAGIGLIALAIWAFTRLSGRISRQLSAESGRSSQWDTDASALALSTEQAVNVHVGSGWTASVLRRSPEGPLRLQARGRVFGPWGWLASPDGDGVAAGLDAPLPGAPELGLLARIDGKIVFVGADGEIPAGPDAPIELRMNVGPLEDATALGYFHVVPA